MPGAGSLLYFNSQNPPHRKDWRNRLHLNVRVTRSCCRTCGWEVLLPFLENTHLMSFISFLVQYLNGCVVFSLSCNLGCFTLFVLHYLTCNSCLTCLFYLNYRIFIFNIWSVMICDWLSHLSSDPYDIGSDL